MVLCTPGNQPRRERKKDTWTQALMKQRCFNDFSEYIKAVLQGISFDNGKDQKTKMYSNHYQGNKVLTMVIRSGDNPYLKKEGQN